MTSAIRDFQLRKEYKTLMTHLGNDFGPGGAHTDLFEIFKSQEGQHNLMFTDVTKRLADVGSRDSYYTWVGKFASRVLFSVLSEVILVSRNLIELKGHFVT